MRFRVVERKRDNGEIYYQIQFRFLWFWWHYSIDKVTTLCEGSVCVNQWNFCFNTIDDAQNTLNHVEKEYEYQGVNIFPTIDEHVFYVLKWSIPNDNREWFDYLIHGSYEYCCKQIDRHLESNKNKKYKKIIPI